jgi:hypothetical protein
LPDSPWHQRLWRCLKHFYIGFSLKHRLEEILCRKVNLVLYTDACSLYHITISLDSTPTERRLAIDLAAVREGFEKREISDIVLIEESSNPAEGCTKFDGNGALETLLETNKVNVIVQAWLERSLPVPPSVASREI